MANIVFCFPPLTSTLNSSFGLAKTLQLAGHNIFYLGIEDCKCLVAENGFDFVTVYTDWFAKGWLENCYLKARYGDDHEHSEAKKIAKNFQKFIEYLIAGGDGEVRAAVEKIQADLVFISTSGLDSIIWALLMHKFKIKFIYLFDVLGGSATHTVPPIHSGLIPSQSRFSAWANACSWQWFRVEKVLLEYYFAWSGIDLMPVSMLKRMASYCAYPYENIQLLTDMPCPQLNIQEIVLWPKEFEFSSENRPGRYYVESAIDLNRKQALFPWEKVDEDRPTVYTAFGTLPVLNSDDAKRFFKIVIDASEKWPDWNWIISIGNNLSVDEFDSVPRNVFIVNRAPQLDILRKSILMITHGGANSIKECLLLGVPIIVFPLVFDEFGNAARVEYHGLGVRGCIKSITASKLQDMVERVTKESCFNENVRKMQSLFSEAEKDKPSIKVIESILADICS
ncbi:nucleotide disphospho-sugar-binding domain-containing protein [Methylomonas sp. TEB]|uniref:nucleotide disphospho-sugar-binding domain-containing protein n=1 Tax=Methylomonas sp. TEB TaxID=3398229 RepID=UPI0039F5B6D2